MNTNNEYTTQQPIEDVQYDYYSTKLAVSTGNEIQIVDVSEEPKLLQTLTQHTNTVFSAKFSHPRFGPILASVSYDGQLLIWKETQQNYQVIYSVKSAQSMNCVSFFPEQYGLKIVGGSIDGNIYVVEYNENMKTFKHTQFKAHSAGVTCVEVIEMNGKPMILSGGIDCLVSLFDFDGKNWVSIAQVKEHDEWLRSISYGVKRGEMFIISADNSHVVVSKFEGNTMKTVQKIEDINGKVDKVQLNGDVLALCIDDGNVEMWKLTDEKFVKEE